MGNVENPILTTVYDNYMHEPGLRTGLGFSCWIELGEETILFDTGGDFGILLGNMEKLGKNPEKINKIVLSHIHGDHTGGLEGILRINPKVTVYFPSSFPDEFNENLKSYGAGIREISQETKIEKGVWTTGELGTWIKEQSLIINSPKGSVVITGCAHPGIVNILREVKRLTGREIYLVLGGFHLEGAGDSDLREIINSFREIGVKKVAPCHCSGERARELFREEYGNDFIDNGVGNVTGT
ncbi:MAG: MBL fold metallo-hydrolase [Candidatus Aenigmarchaeota archaeon]|nr:MBL fold metallo-hydrolase [Candidatus Aenigmarchaeota archaeon]